MRLRLIYPSARKSRELAWWKQPRAHRFLGLGLLNVAALCPPTIETKIIDDEYDDIDYDERIDLAGISLLTPNALRAYEIAREYRERGVPVVLGGPHATACPEEGLEHADSVVTGEAEDTWPHLLEDFSNGTLQRIYKSSNNSDLSKMPLPRRDLVDKRRYVTINTVQATRGCPFNCEFCSITSLFGNVTRFRPIDRVIDEIKSLEGNSFLLTDDNIAQASNYYKELFRRLIPLKKRWVGEASWNVVRDDETLELLERSGCFGLFIGFESLEPQEGVRKINPAYDNSLLYKEVIDKLHRRRINVDGAFIFGFDNEDESIFGRFLEFALDSHLDAAAINILTPFPGTPLHRRLEEEGRLTERNWNNYMTCNLCFEPMNISRRTFLEKYDWVIRKFHTYTRIARRMSRAARISTPREVGFLLGINLGCKKLIKDRDAEIQALP